ncbi:enoyl-CoA hydratase/isomerase family protein [Bosea sp. (in: a-proteobacteria)]|uniref:enoyl-CoA hydratase/isomerase family protein n=1 Tax=Bosea sp. (in: a-proteobacteria) TaxID=1871050 RepID=UPI002631E6F1|nr:enoyl-CoA hydratase/isomerase family protein [Bosea sp. (in: a-proteobacteria)]MCO5092915.1 enoyl-CoA hydratase/isomerase family protein [Bosea sp. (in: a-proteobacteria)]
MTDVVLTDLHNGVLTVTLNRPEDNNRIDRRTTAAIIAAIDRAATDKAVRVIVVTGAAPYFCGGGRPDGHPHGTLEQRSAYALAFVQMQEAFARANVPIVARVGGHCVAGGMSLLSFCDLAVAADDVEFGYPEVNYGQFPALALAVLIPMVPPKEAFDILYSGDRFSAARALELRLVNKVVPRSGLDAAVAEYIAMLKSKNQVSVGLGRRAYYAMTPMTPASRLEYAQTFLMTLLAAEGTGQVPPPAKHD